MKSEDDPVSGKDSKETKDEELKHNRQRRGMI